MTINPKLKRTGRIISGYVRCHWYLLRHGMWRGECELTGYDQNNRLLVIAAVKGSILKGTAEFTEVFYIDDAAKNDPVPGVRGTPAGAQNKVPNRQPGDSGAA